MKLRKATIILALVAVLAVSGSAASSAQAVPTFAAGGYKATLQGTQVEAIVFELSEEISCTTSEFTGSMSEAETMLVLTPIVGGCHGGAFGVYVASINYNKCFYTVSVTKKATKGEFSHIGTANLECPGGTELVEIQLRNALNILVCEYTIAPATGLSEMQYGTMEGTPKDLTINWQVGALPYKKRVGTVANCGLASNNGTYTGNATFTAKNEKGTQVNLEVTGP